MNLEKIKRDQYYSELYNEYGYDFIQKAGYFEDNSKLNYNINNSLNIDCTPIHFISKNLPNNPCILLTTGSFCPIHKGHVDMMLKAKEAVELKGFNVIAGYFAPDHDEYIKSKLGEESIPFHYRMKYILDMIKDIEWLTVDPWAGVFRTVDINFTDIIYRLELYIEKHFGIKIPIIFVCGADRANFAKTFKNKGYCCVVGRNTYKYDEQLKGLSEDRIFFINKDDNYSSTDIRKNNKWEYKNKNLKLRMVKDPRSYKILKLLYENFQEIDVKFVQDQHNQIFKRFGRSYKKNKNLISLDSMTELNYNIFISRNYDNFGIKQLGFTNRPNSLKLEEQLKNIPDNQSYILCDDDIHTGSTMNYVEKLLIEKNIKIIEKYAFSKSKEEEILDINDFFYSENSIENNDLNNGLVINNKRYPYIYPYVCPFIRGSINNPLDFSIKVWEINMNHYHIKNMLREYSFCLKNYQLLKNLK
jgi:nicotinic acid mononucleotide adenylyltransferase